MSADERRCAVCTIRLAGAAPPWAPQGSRYGLCFSCAERSPVLARQALQRSLRVEAQGPHVVRGAPLASIGAEAPRSAYVRVVWAASRFLPVPAEPPVTSRRRGNLSRTPWARIVIAAENGKGLRLTRQDVRDLVGDYAIATRGRNDLDQRDSEWDDAGSWRDSVRP